MSVVYASTPCKKCGAPRRIRPNGKARCDRCTSEQRHLYLSQPDVREKRKAIQREYYEQNKDRIKAQLAKYYQSHKWESKTQSIRNKSGSHKRYDSNDPVAPCRTCGAARRIRPNGKARCDRCNKERKDKSRARDNARELKRYYINKKEILAKRAQHRQEHKLEYHLRYERTKERYRATRTKYSESYKHKRLKYSALPPERIAKKNIQKMTGLPAKQIPADLVLLKLEQMVLSRLLKEARDEVKKQTKKDSRDD